MVALLRRPCGLVSLLLALVAFQPEPAAAAPTGPMDCAPVHTLVNAHDDRQVYHRTVCADVVALDQMLVYNRFGSFNPFGMIFALRRDVVESDAAAKAITADDCDAHPANPAAARDLQPGSVRLRDCKRPRPMVLRTNAGDVLHVRVQNLLRPAAPDISQTFCSLPIAAPVGRAYQRLRAWVSQGDTSQRDHGEVLCDETLSHPAEAAGDWPASRGLDFAVQGLTAIGIENGQIAPRPHPACIGMRAIPTGASIDCYYRIDQEGPFFVASNAAPAGGEGNGGSITHGLFAAVLGEPARASWYRSQVSRGSFDKVWPAAAGTRHARADLGGIDRYETRDDDGVPVLNMLDQRPDGTAEIVHSDLNAIVNIPATDAQPARSFREFSVFFHDELKSFFTRNFEELSDFGEGQMAGVRDGFAINYGSSGMGDLLLANRKGIGPAANCAECLYEEFFLTSWANGDPALLEQFSDDPSNVHHSYLNDAIVFRNFHAGPKETHVFHLHAHQWFAGNDGARGAYLDSQTVAPQQGFSYDIYGGGLDVYHRGAPGQPGWHETLGSGNRNRTVGDSIFHCHLYPHFAQGMWELWRVHDALEDGTRKLPDGQWEPDLSLAEMDEATRAKKRPGSVDPASGRWIGAGAGLSAPQVGTPVPALVPLPGQAWPLLPTYPAGEAVLTADAGLTAPDGSPLPPAPAVLDGFPGYPFYIGGAPGHRPPQAPMDIATDLTRPGEYLDGGLPRHVMGDASQREFPFETPPLPQLGPVAQLADAAKPTPREAVQRQIVAKALALGDMTMRLRSLAITALAYDGSPIERTGMGFHHDGTAGGAPLKLADAVGNAVAFQGAKGGYPSVATGGSPALFGVNGAAPKPGAPFADPCGAPRGLGNVVRGPAGAFIFRADGGAEFPLMASDAAGPGGAAPPGASNPGPASEDDISNWVAWGRKDENPQGRRHLYYIGAGGAPVAIDLPPMLAEGDPLHPDPGFVADPAVIGYRRYEASAVQVDLVTNRAGWHDPQGRINVLSAASDGYKDGGGRISPKVSASEEPFFFRALSGECIEFRHTNELPKDLELDDFEVRTPTDTIGQHIHLVKFDVTASDGSANGWNYEDGTLAPDEIAARICAAKNGTPGLVTSQRAAGAPLLRERPGLCALRPPPDDPGGAPYWQVAEEYEHRIWQAKLSGNRDLFQTTVQRWFADPILSSTRAANDGTGAGQADRTLRTVFSHDHFGPSSIQQHGFYTALVIEPQDAQVCSAAKADCTPRRIDRRLIEAGPLDVGARKIVIDNQPLGDTANGARPREYALAEFREYALAIADFATLYDPRRSIQPADLDQAPNPADEARVRGLAMLLCEAERAGDPQKLARDCHGGSGDVPADVLARRPGDTPPSWVANGMPGDAPAHAAGLVPGLMTTDRARAEVAALREHLISWRQRAAGHTPSPTAPMAGPVSPPQRPESISVDHHDPYLVNYRGEPLPLRLGWSSAGSDDCRPRPLAEWTAALKTGVTEHCEISRPRAGAQGEMANVFLSPVHGDPVTPILDAFDGDPLMIRLIQGAQEVQHTFTLDGYHWTRNLDQPFPQATPRRSDVTPAETLGRECRAARLPSGAPVVAGGRPEQYRRWLSQGAGAFTRADAEYWSAYERQLANCFDLEGRKTAQEVGISEHFEFTAAYRHDSNLMAGGPVVQNQRAIVSAADRVDRTADWLEMQLLRDVPSDTLYTFGSQDAIWNGAWGLVRVHRRAPLGVPAMPTNRDRETTLDLERLRDIARQLKQLDRRVPIGPPGPVEIDQASQLVTEAEGLSSRLQDRLLPGAATRLPPLGTGLPGLAPNIRLPGPGIELNRRPNLDQRLEPDRRGGSLTRHGVRLAQARIPEGTRIDVPQPILPRDRLVLDPRIKLPPLLPDRPEPAAENPVLRFEPDGRQNMAAEIAAVPQLQQTAERLIPLGTARQAAAATSQPGSPPHIVPQFGARAAQSMRMMTRGAALVPPAHRLVGACDPRAPQVHAAVVAIEAQRVFGPQGTAYSDRLTDRDGLFLALVDPRRLIAPAAPDSVSAAMLEDAANWASVPLPAIIDAVRAGYDRPEPLVLTVNAGDCVKMTWIDAMQGAPGLPDSPGDAPMPGITSLNVDAGWSGGDAAADGPIHRTADAAQPQVAPSARLAISLPLPVLNHGQSFGRPIGANPVWSAAPAPSGGGTLTINDHAPRFFRTRAAQIEQFEFYAGFAVGIEDRPDLIASLTPSTLFDLAALSPALSAEARAIVLDPASGQTFGTVMDRIAATARDARLRVEPVERALSSPGTTLRLTPPQPEGLAVRDGLAAPLPPRLAAAAAMRIETGGETLSRAARIEGGGAAATVDLPTAVAAAVDGGTLTADDAARALDQLRLADSEMLRQLDELQVLPGIEPVAGLAARLRLRFVPYAFGALPLRSHADMIGHPSHGLIGAVVVVPQSARITDARAPKHAIPASRRLPVRPLSPGDRMVVRPERLDAVRLLACGSSLPGPRPQRACTQQVIVPQKGPLPLWSALLEVPGADGAPAHRIRQFTLLMQDGLNLRDSGTQDVHDAGNGNEHLVSDCAICNDSYDFGEKAVNYIAEPYNIRLSRRGAPGVESHSNLNLRDFGPDFFRLAPGEVAHPPMPVLRAEAGEEIVVHVVHPGGRARQHSFDTVAQDYDDLFPGFGFPHSALLGPGKAVVASISRKPAQDCYLWTDGATQLAAGGVWGLIDVVAKGRIAAGDTSCGAQP